MAQQKKSLITRMLEGREKSEEYARSTLPTNRWQLFWDIFKGNFGKIFKVNVLILLFFLPTIGLVIFGSLFTQTYGTILGFGSNIGVGYPAMPALKGSAEMLIFRVDMIVGIGIIFSSFIAAVGLAGGMYVVRNMVWTEGIFVANDFWKGVKLNYKNALQTALLFSIVYLLTQAFLNMSTLMLLGDGLGKVQATLMRSSRVMSYLFMFVAAMVSFWMIALGVNYEMKFVQLFKNSLLLSVGTLPQTIFFGALALLPFIFLFVSVTFLTALGVICLVLLSFAYALLVWLDFSQWVFDKYINPKISGAKVGRGIYNQDGSSQITGEESGAALEYQRMILSHGKSRLVARPIKPIDDSMQVYELPTAFTREDLKKLRESKQNIVEDSEQYAEEHKNDLRYVEYNRRFDERERALQEEDLKTKKKKSK